ncbi:MAG: DNA/RNA non-specific endonuclease [Prevotellaceae bacterium]|nr:DNA/RNA non-specific endonuclease [Candidatus Colivivens equi]
MKRVLLILSSIIILAASCSKDNEDDINIRPYTPNTKYLSRLEVPKMLSGSKTRFIQHSTRINNDSVMTYCLEYDLEHYHSRWVAFRFDGLTRGVSAGRSDAWADDPALSDEYWIGAGTFNGNGVRGHICASYDRRYSVEADRQTFYMTNMTPMSYDFNGSYWSKFESYVQNLGRTTNFADTLYIVKGGTIYDGETKGTVRSSKGKIIPIPKHYFIALLRLKAGKYSALGFWVEHKEYGRSATSADVREAAVTIDYLEQQTGIDFFHNLPDNIETTVERDYSSTEWKL